MSATSTLTKPASSLQSPLRHGRSPASQNAPRPAAAVRHVQVPRYIQGICYLWTMVCTSSNIKVEFVPYIDWITCLALFVWLSRYAKADRLLPKFLLIGAVLFAGFTAERYLDAGVWAGKLAVIFLFLASFQQVPELARVAFRAFIAAIYVNVLLIALSMIGVPGVSEVVGAYGRRATILNYPGSLWHTSLGATFYFSYLLSCAATFSVRTCLGLIACLTVMWCDGSRTGFLLLLCIPAMLTLVLFIESRISAVWPAVFGLFVLTMFLLSLFNADDQSAIGRFLPMLKGGADTTGMLTTIDSTRFDMLQYALDLISAHPIAGNGIGAASIETNVPGMERMVVHNGYLQAWADLGLVGLLAYIAVVGAWIPSTGLYLSIIQRRSDPFERAFYYNALFMLFCFNVCLLFHPLSYEWSEWIQFVIPFAALTSMVARSPARRPAHA